MRFAASSPEIARKDDSDTEDDYMSDMFTDTTSDVRPGMERTHSERRIMKIDYERSQVEFRLRSVPKRAELEKEMRETALSKPISEESKGFALMAKMGFKPGMSLGKAREGREDGIKEPISVDIKTNRMGLGHKAEEDERRRQIDSLVRKRVAARAKSNQDILGDFQKRKRIAAGQKRLIEDVMKSRKACQELDLRNGLSVPTGEYFWPIYKDRDEDDSKPSTSTREVVDDQDDDQYEEGVFRYSNGELAPSEQKLSLMLEEELQQRLEDVKTYLRDIHLYCVWCGCQYETSAELSAECPGDAREDHEGFDE